MASGSILGDQNNKSLDSKRQNTSVYSWEQSWKTENKNQVTTVTTSTSGIVPPGTGFSKVAASIWSYHYSYSSNTGYSTDSTTRTSDSTTSTSDSTASISDFSMSPSVTYNSPKPVQKTNPSTVVQKKEKSKPGYTNSQPGYTNTTIPGYTSTQTSYTNTNPRYSSNAFGLTPGRFGPFGNTSALPSLSESVRGSDTQKWLDLHNNYRSQYGVASVTWSDELVPTAQRQVEKCIWRHTRLNKYGENIAAGQNSASDVVVAWVEGPNEREIWNPQSATPTHFTQVVWKATRQIGCAYKTCISVEGSNLPQSPVTLWACEYNPKGNVQGEYVSNVLAATGGKPLGSIPSANSVDP